MTVPFLKTTYEWDSPYNRLIGIGTVPGIQMMDRVTGAVMAGGESRRFGADKALASWNGRTLVENAVEILGELFPSLLVLVKEPEAFAFLKGANLRVAKDLIRETHPLGGIASALSYARTEHVFVCACDMPFLRGELISALWEACHGYDACVPVWQGRFQPLCGIYSQKCLGVMERMMKDECLKIQMLFDRVPTRFFTEKEVLPVDPQGLSFVDLDTREEYERARGLLLRGGKQG